MIHPARFVVTAVGGLLFGVIGPAEPYAPTTHAELGAVAVERSNLDAILKNQYGVDGGTSFAIDGQAIRTWIAIGATREDFPERFVRSTTSTARSTRGLMRVGRLANRPSTGSKTRIRDWAERGRGRWLVSASSIS